MKNILHSFLNYPAIFLTIFFLLSTNLTTAQIATFSAGQDQINCLGGNINLSMTYSPVKSTTTYVVDSITYNPNSFTDGSLALATDVDDIYSAKIELGFCFNFYGNTYTKCLIGSNGVVTFDTTFVNNYCPWSFSNVNQLPSSAVPKNAIMTPYYDLDPSINPTTGTSDIYYTTIGTAPFRKFVVSWTNSPLFSCTNMLANQQVVLYETTNIIEVIIKDKPICPSWNAGLAILGIQNIDGTIATAAPGKNATQWSATEKAYRFSPDGMELSSVQWLNNGSVVSSSPATTTTPSIDPSYVAQLTVPTCNGDYITSDTMTVFSNSASPSISTNQGTICQGQTATITVSPIVNGGSTIWSNGDTEASTTVSPTSTETFSVDYTGCNGLVTLTQEIVVIPFDPTIISGGEDVTICQNMPVSLFGSGAESYTWDNGIIDGEIFYPSVGSHTYTVTGIDVNGCFSTDEVTVIVLDSITPNFSASYSACQGSSFQLPTTSSDIPPISGTWSPVVSTDNVGSVTYTFTATSGQCINTVETILNVSEMVTPTFTPFDDICQNDEDFVFPTSSIELINGTWSPSLSTDVVGTSVYTFSPSVDQCANQVQYSLTVNPVPDIPTITCNNYVFTSSTADSYQWYLNGIIINGAINQSYTVTQNGSYAVEVGNSYGCTTFSPYLQPWGISEKVKNFIHVFPNPSTGLFSISLDHFDNIKSLKVYNAVGSVVYASKSFMKEIDLTNHTKGLYFLKIEMDEQTYVTKLIVK